MTTPWSSLYCPSNDTEALANALRESLSALGYELYNPFGMIPGKAYRQSVKVFIAPPSNSWVRVIGEPDEQLLSHFSRFLPCLYIALDADVGHIRTYTAGAPADTASILLPYLRPGRTANELQQIIAGDSAAYGALIASNVIPLEDSPTVIPLSALSDDVQALASRVNPSQAQKLFSRLSGDVLKKAGNDKGKIADARALVSGEPAPDWNSLSGQQIRALMACLTIPETWREPDFTALRDAYPLYERRRRNPNARLYPGDDVAMARVPDALAYVPIYGGMM